MCSPKIRVASGIRKFVMLDVSLRTSQLKHSTSHVPTLTDNKWSKIKRAKGANDTQRGHQTSKITRQIISSVKAGGGESDPSHNLLLATALQLARAHQVPKATIEAALKKATGSGPAEADLHTSTYEALAPPGVALIIEALTDNKNRTHAEIRHLLGKRGASITPVAYLFRKSGRVVFSSGTSGHSLALLEENAIDAEVEDIAHVDEEEGTIEVLCGVRDVLNVTRRLTQYGYEMREFEAAYISEEKVDIPDSDNEEFAALLEVLENRDDVVRVHHNAS
ncbi:hypothetical protein HKX48_007734 [Thoreauomyces humboldtii]|nr:hypothetical protein HKX48_007734 [Thoreauomyces humboldtii]